MYFSNPRQYLCARVLRGRSVSVLLERRLSLVFSHCFPHKTPCLMLQDLDTSAALMDRFCDTELIESLDQLIVQAAAQDQVSSHEPLCIHCIHYTCRLIPKTLILISQTLNYCSLIPLSQS